MFVQVISGSIADRDGMREAMERWNRDVRAGAVGFLGGTAGVTDDGTLVNVARFESRAAAEANATRPEQSAWWEQTASCFASEPLFRESEDVTVYQRGDLDSAGFVQVMEGRVLDPAAARAMQSEVEAMLARERPDVLGDLQVIFDDSSFVDFVYFASEAAARAGESSERSAEGDELFERMYSVMDVSGFHDLREVWLIEGREPQQEGR